MLRSPLRLLVAAAILSGSVALVGAGWETARYGLDDRATASALERDVRRRLAQRTRHIESLAQRIARDEASRISDGVASQDALAVLFSRLIDLARLAGPSGAVSATVYVPHGAGYRVLAWSDGPAETLAPDRLSGPSMLFIAPGTVGLRLVYVQPIESSGHRLAVVATETVLSPVTNVGFTDDAFRFGTTFGPVTVLPIAYGAGEGRDRPNTFVIASADGVPLLEVSYSPEQLTAGRDGFRRRVIVAAALPLVAALLLLTAFVRPWQGRSVRRRPTLWSSDLIVALMLVAAAGTFILLFRVVAAPIGVEHGVIGMTSLGLAFLMPVSWWWRSGRRRVARAAAVRFGLEHLAGGLALALMLWSATRVIEARLAATSLDRWRSPLFPFDLDNILSLVGVLLLQTALCWAGASLLALLAARWRLSWSNPGFGAVAVMLWLLPTIGLAVVFGSRAPLPIAGLVATAGTATFFALLAGTIRRYYRHTTQAMRLLFAFTALVLPVIVLYPVAAFHAEARAKHLIETEYMPATLNHRDDLLAHLNRAREEIDRMPALATGIPTRAAGAPITSARAFPVWNQTALSRNRVTSEIELYGPDRVMTSRFALNVPQYQSLPGSDAWEGASCAWSVYSRVQRFGAEDRSMWHAERAICDPSGRVLGGVVVHVVPDYRSLPFVSVGNPYRDALAGGDPPPSRVEFSDLQTVIYGWAFYPLFSSSRVAWPVGAELADRLYQSREPFWTTLTVDEESYHVFFANDRAGIYALGYPVAGSFRHTSRLAEVATVMAGVFVILLVGATAYAPFTRRRNTPLRELVTEIRTSFYRKLFLFFVLAAIVPVVLLTLAFGAYMGNRFQADVEYEAAEVASVARRVFELASAERAPGSPTLLPDDDVMVWIQQVIEQDVNLYQRAQLAATSQRDLFDSGLLPQRTPASAYRSIVLTRQPSYVAEDRIGTFQYLVAAAPVATSREAMLTVPLALRQREIAQQLELLNRGMLVAAVVVVLFAAGLGASVAGRVSDPVSRLTRATRLIAAGRLDVRIVADTADELRRLVDDFNSMAETLAAQRTELARTNQLKAWAEMARQVAHEIKNPLTPIQLAAEHLQRVHEDRGRPMGAVFDQCVTTIIRQVKLLRQIASEFSNFAAQPAPRLADASIAGLVEEVLEGYRVGGGRVRLDVTVPADLPPVRVDRTLILRALTNIVENAVQAMPTGGTLSVRASAEGGAATIVIADTGVGMDATAVERAFEPYFSTKTAGSGLGLANAKRNIELCGGTIALASQPGAGTIVTVTLPAGPARPAVEDESPPAR